jgi:predicted solute-binding protein
MPTVTDDNTGEEIEVQPVHATVTAASVNSFKSELPRGSAKLIETAMANAVAQAMEQGITDAEELREIIQKARQSSRQAIMTYVREHNSQVAAQEK